MMSPKAVTILTIAGSDPTGGAGIQADLRTFDRLGARGVSVVSAVTAQDSAGVGGVYPVTGDAFSRQLETVLNDFSLDGVKTGMLLTAENVHITAGLLRKYPAGLVIIDPVLSSSNGVALLETEGRRLLVEQLLPLATVVTPNLSEARLMSGLEQSGFEDESTWVTAMAREIYARGTKYVVITGGHRSGDPVDLLFDGESFTQLKGPRIAKSLHGSGCIFSSALCTYLATGSSITEAVKRAKKYTSVCFQKDGKNLPPFSSD
jgi:hydroxymethylpyrimidine/phosphomethylpyrimidine kinase